MFNNSINEKKNIKTIRNKTHHVLPIPHKIDYNRERNRFFLLFSFCNSIHYIGQ